MRISFFTYLKYAWGNRRSNASHANWAASLSGYAATPAAAYWPQNSAKAAGYPEADNGWRYDFTRLPVYDELLETYKLNEIAGQGTAFEQALRLMAWLTAHTAYNGMEIRACYRFQGEKETAPRILRYAYQGGYRQAINCTHKAIVFAGCLQAVGVHAMPLGLWSWTYRSGEEAVSPTPCHFVVHAWLPEEQRWVAFDPSFNSYFTDSEGRALNLIEIQKKHRAGEAMRVAQYDFNGTQDCRDSYFSGFILGALLEITAKNSADAGEFCNQLLPTDVLPQDDMKRAITVAELLAPPNL
jgi:hypothetical protein